MCQIIWNNQLRLRCMLCLGWLETTSKDGNMATCVTEYQRSRFMQWFTCSQHQKASKNQESTIEVCLGIIGHYFRSLGFNHSKGSKRMVLDLTSPMIRYDKVLVGLLECSHGFVWNGNRGFDGSSFSILPMKLQRGNTFATACHPTAWVSGK